MKESTNVFEEEIADGFDEILDELGIKYDEYIPELFIVPRQYGLQTLEIWGEIKEDVESVAEMFEKKFGLKRVDSYVEGATYCISFGNWDVQKYGYPTGFIRWLDFQFDDEPFDSGNVYEYVGWALHAYKHNEALMKTYFDIIG